VRRRHAYQKLAKRSSAHLDRVALSLTGKITGVLLHVRAVFKEVLLATEKDTTLRRCQRVQLG